MKIIVSFSFHGKKKGLLCYVSRTTRAGLFESRLTFSLRVAVPTPRGKTGGRVGAATRRLVNVNPRLKVNRRSNFPSMKMLSTAYVLCSLRVFMLKTKGQKI